MSQTLLISRDDIVEYRSISANLNTTKKLSPYILEAQEVDIKNLLGNALYNSLIQDYEASPSLATYSDLFNGSSWECESKTYYHRGIKVVLIYFAYARYLINSPFESTAFGTVVKKDQYSEVQDQKSIQRNYEDTINLALSFWQDVKKYLDQSSIDLWNCSTNANYTRISAADPLRHGNNRYSTKNRYSR